jgi:ABC-type glutathione transport system ATPase component
MTTEIEGGLLDWDERNAGAAPYVRISNVSKAYDTGDNPAFALQDISLDIIAGEFLSVVGPSGCGKSTLLNPGNRLPALRCNQIQSVGSLIGRDERAADEVGENRKRGPIHVSGDFADAGYACWPGTAPAGEPPF